MTTSKAQRPGQTGDHPADAVRRILNAAEVFTISIVGGPGSGKTAFIEKTLAYLSDSKVGVISCCIPRSGPDTEKIGNDGITHVQVKLDEGQQLDASQLLIALQEPALRTLDLLFIENPGTLAVPPGLDLGQHVSVGLFSVAGGDDKAAKHPKVVKAADVLILNKIDLLGKTPFTLATFEADVHRLHPDAPVFEVSALNGTGIEAWVQWLIGRAQEIKRQESHWFG